MRNAIKADEIIPAPGSHAEPAGRKPARSASEIALENLTLAEELVRAETAERLAKLKNERDALCQIRSPIFQMLQAREEILRLIEYNRGSKAYYETWAATFQNALHAAMRCDNARGDLWRVWERYEAESRAQRIIGEIDLWISTQEAKLPALEVQIKDYATQHGLEDIPAVAALFNPPA